MTIVLVGIDSYSFHRYFGEIYPQQTDPGTRWDMKDDFIPFAVSLDVDEVALETLFFPAFDDSYCAAVNDALDEAGLRRVIGWGHPDGLHRGQDADALEDLIRHIPRAGKVGADIMRIVASSMLYVDEPHGPQVEASIRMLKEATKVAEDNGVTLAIENHIDFTSLEILEIVQAIDSPNFRVNFDTGNALRLYEDPVEAARNLAPYTVATHTKDIITRRGGAPSERFLFWPSCPAGEGLIDFHGIARVLDDAGFEGSLAIELDLLAAPWNDRTEEENVTQSIAFLKSVVADLESSKVPEASA
ncbi:sugar phosphate isomerase/epimerase family protein [Herbiconiux sp. UC225_62]|uniref:sugar phosphate isomerase/epimerase family protein n=1 Tax=Herbiconiux sp. UC225_62 TaxID=3350168 RepID=UPI0036D3E462